jgi:hypothetical protein
MAMMRHATKMMSAAVVLTASALMSLPVFAAPADVSIDGYVSDSKCGRAHGAEGPDVACVNKCISQGAKPVFVDDKTGSVWAIDDPDAVKGHYGHHITMTGTADAGSKTVHISKVTMLAKQ